MRKRIAAIIPILMMVAIYLISKVFGRMIAEPGEPVEYRDYDYVISVIPFAAYLVGYASHALYKKLAQ
ncbi:hypothetical protein [Paenibacillus ginsengarvi]|uniref:Uncharacterized protein n=1 Tax=Paenibacillus ginsengarvi TaxID=400777 RepID=A0A3B0CML8_9BACL|nr:hypothetical protein [Paenibacillus ginsengarvi]RKN86200.1 hypothetical protein D7M11_04095 [Paenibacillus ginsengarvi]